MLLPSAPLCRVVRAQLISTAFPLCGSRRVSSLRPTSDRSSSEVLGVTWNRVLKVPPLL